MKPNQIIQATLTSLENPEINRVNCYKLEQTGRVPNFEGDLLRGGVPAESCGGVDPAPHLAPHRH